MDLDLFQSRPWRRRSAIRYAMLAVLSLGIPINYIDRSITSVALPAMHTELHLTPASGWTSRAEIEHIECGHEADTDPGVRLRDLFRFRAIHAMSFGFFSVNFVSYFFFTWFPTYLISTYHLSMLKFGIIGMLPGIAAIVGGWIGGLISDGLFRHGISLTLSRKIPLVVGMLGSSVIALAAFSPTVGLSLTCLCLANACSTGAASALWALPGDIAPNQALIGSIGGIQNTAANVAGIVSPLLIGVLMGYTHSFVAPLLIAGGVAILGALTYGLWLPKVEPLRIGGAR
jgi:ACS family glucarate transporter-like MFS transporter